MVKRPKIKITLIDKKEKGACHYGHKISNSFRFIFYSKRESPIF
ncbi:MULTISPECIES: hypothetical protein [unclassified Clostridioides]